MFLARTPAMDPALSWYGAILDHAVEQECVFLHGDDDLVLPGGFYARLKALESSSASILISKHLGRLVYAGTDAFHAQPLRTIVPGEVTGLQLGDALLANAPFIGNNAYRFTPAFRRTLETTLALTEQQTWLPARERTIMLPLYLPLVALHLGEAVAGLDQCCEMRGMSREDVIAWPFRPAHWNNGYLYGTVLDFLNLPALAGNPGLDGERDHHRRLCAQCFHTTVGDTRIPQPLRDAWRRQIAPRLDGLQPLIFKSALAAIHQRCGLKSLILWLKFAVRRPRRVRFQLLDVLFANATKRP
jgi:hypothetical protein